MSVAAVGAEAATEGLPPTAAQAGAWAPGNLNSTCLFGDAVCDADLLFDRSTEAASGRGAFLVGRARRSRARGFHPLHFNRAVMFCLSLLVAPLMQCLQVLTAGVVLQPSGEKGGASEQWNVIFEVGYGRSTS